MRRRYKLLVFRKASGQYISLVVEWQDNNRAWHSRTVRSDGVTTQQARTQAQADLQELEQIAGDATAPIPVGTIGDAVWAGFVGGLNDPLLGLTLGPVLAVRDLTHLGSYLISMASENLERKVSVTQPDMPANERTQFTQWLRQHSNEDQALVLAYQWRYEP